MAGCFFFSPVLPTAWFLLSLVKGTAAGDYCLNSLYIEYCRYGCCGSKLNSNCCPMNLSLIVVCVVGGIACIAIIVTVVCCIVKKQGYRGRVVGPHGSMPVAGAGNNVTVVHSNNAAMGYATAPPPPNPYMAGYPPQPGYNPPPGNPPPPPPYVYSNPAYPPPPAPMAAGGVGGGGGGFAAPAAPGYTPSSAAP